MSFHKLISRLRIKPLSPLNNIRTVSKMSAAPSGSGCEEDLSNQCPGEKTTDRLPKKVKRAARRAERKRAEKKKIAEKRAKARVDSYVNKSDVISCDDLELTSYYAENGLRRVYPYVFKFASYAKARWVGRNITELFTDEFRLQKHTFVKHLECGKVTVNQNKVGENYVVKGKDYVINIVHRHERPVTAAPIEIIEDTEELLVVNKPASIPIHPCGKHRFNTLTYILAKQYGYRNLRTIYRLDRMTSGLMIFSKVQGRAFEMAKAIQNRQTEKTYVSRVEGEFPEGVVECREPLKVLCLKIGLQHVSADGKDAHTTFERLSYNGKSSVVQCRPHTGRTHQIRVHLQFLGHPIVNDGLYNSDAWGPQRGKNGEYGKSLQQLVEDIYQCHDADFKYKDMGPSSESNKNSDNQDTCNKDSSPCDDSNAASVTIGDNPDSEIMQSERTERTGTNSSETKPSETIQCSDTENKIITESESSNLSNEQPIKRLKTDIDDRDATVNNACSTNATSNPKLNCSGSKTIILPKFDPSKLVYDTNCEECQKVYTDPKPSDLIMYLHAWKNKGPTWDYSTELPEWAKEDWTE